MVNIEYTGVNGNVTRFGSSSAEHAMERLRGIKGYNGTLIDDVAANLAVAFASRHNINTDRVRMINRNPTRFSGVSSGNIYYSNNGTVAKCNEVSGISVRNGSIVSTSQPKYVSTSGNVVAVGTKREDRVADIVTASEVRDIARDVAVSVYKEISNKTEESKEV